nr:8-oxo-dGTP diphosphatase [Candidatus Gracilibacteria bacterium]
MLQSNLGIIIKDNKILLCMKKRGFGVGKWNSAGGKLDSCETIEQCMVRELKEETNLDAKESDLKKVGVLHFDFIDKQDWNQDVSIFMINEFSGEPIETEEMIPKWFNIDEIPYSEMWEDDIYWLPRIINGEEVEYKFNFENGKIKNFKKIK